MRFLSRSRLKILGALLGLVGLLGVAAVVMYLNSERFHEEARRYIVRVLEDRTGGVVTLNRFTWDILHQRFRLEGLTIRGLEPQNESPLAQIDSVDVGISFRSLIRRRLDLFLLLVTRPQFHVQVDSQGRTNIPTPKSSQSADDFNLALSIDNFNIVEGIAAINERRIDIDFAITNLESALKYNGATQVLSSQVQFDGSLNRTNFSIPYTLTGQLDYTRGTILAQRIDITSGKSLVTAQGRINDVLTRNILARLEYKGALDTPFLNYFFVDEKFAGKADVTGLLEFSLGYIFTRGTTSTERVEFDGWTATDVRSEYSYHYPDKRLALRNLQTQVAGGSARGSIVVEALPGNSRVLLDLNYQDVDAAAMARAYPWDPKYRIYSRVTGTLNGWFQGKFDRFQFGGDALFASYNPTPIPGIVPLPLEGSTQYDLQPGQAHVSNAMVRFFSTSIQADGVIDINDSNLRVMLSSSDLRDLNFIYADANGAGSFDGTVTGPIKAPTADGRIVLDGHKYADWTIQHASGNARLDTLTKMAELRDVHVVQGDSEVVVNGRTALDGKTIDLRLTTERLNGSDLSPFVRRKIAGMFSGSAHVTSIEPLHIEGDVRANNLIFEDRLIGDVRSHVQYLEPAAEFDQLSVSRNGSTLTGSFAYNLRTEQIKFDVRVASLPLDSIRDVGLPEFITGTIQNAQLTGDGNRSQPNVRGGAVIQNFVIYGEAFPQATITLNSIGPNVSLSLEAARNLNLTAQINAAGSGFPFTASASFTSYSVERLLGLTQGKLTLTGRADLAGNLSDKGRLRGSGQIQSADVEVQGKALKSTRPFTFAFDANQLTLSGISLTGEGTAVNLAGAVGLTQTATLNLDVNGRVDLALLSAAYPAWISTGSVNVDGLIAGSIKNPDLRGIAHFDNASFGRRGVFTSLSSLTGDVFFNENRVTLNNLQGRVGGGSVQIQGTGLLVGAKLESLNVRIETDDVRIRYPEGLRTVVDGAMVLRGSSDAPRLEGNLEIQSMAYRSEFDQFLALLQGEGLADSTSPLARLSLAIHIEGARNISIQNELADVEARVDLDIKGTAAKPGLSGHIEASGGTLVFQGTRYQITRGNIDFVDPVRIEPVVDIQAEADLREYRVILGISGRGDKMRLDTRSDPPLSQLEIVSLIAGGKTGEELQAKSEGLQTKSGVPSNERLFQGGAASILFDLLKQRVGNKFGLMGLDRVRIDPFLIGPENNPTARITIPVQVTKDLSITYSRDLSSNREEIIQIEYFVSRNTSVVATRDETGALGLDIAHRTRF